LDAKISCLATEPHSLEADDVRIWPHATMYIWAC